MPLLIVEQRDILRVIKYLNNCRSTARERLETERRYEKRIEANARASAYDVAIRKLERLVDE